MAGKRSGCRFYTSGRLARLVGLSSSGGLSGPVLEKQVAPPEKGARNDRDKIVIYRLLRIFRTQNAVGVDFVEVGLKALLHRVW